MEGRKPFLNLTIGYGGIGYGIRRRFKVRFNVV